MSQIQYSNSMRIDQYNDDIFKLTPIEQEILDAVKMEADADGLLSLLRDLRAERQLEFQIYSSREQWFWVPWTVLLAGTVAAISSASGLAAVVLPPMAGACAQAVGLWRRPGLEESLRALNQRHKWTHWLTKCDAKDPSARMFGFRFRTETEVDRDARDRVEIDRDLRHVLGFEYPINVIRFTPWVWGLLWFAGGVRFWNSGESHALKKWMGWA